MKRLLQSIGPALIVAAVVLGPGSILTSSKVGASFGLVGVPIIIGAAILMIAMVALSARLGVVYESSLCDELAARLGRGVTILIGLILFTLVALFQSSNNIAIIGGLEPLITEETLSSSARVVVLIAFNAVILGILYRMRDLYRFIEKLMKFLIAFMCAAFVVNFLLVLFNPPDFEPVRPTGSPDLIPLLGMIGTTFSVGGAFYQAYLVKERGWGMGDVRKGMLDSMVSISVLGIITVIILLTAWRTFYGMPGGVTLASVGDVARQLEPLFGSGARYIFAGGILAGALSSFLVNAMIGGTVMSDALGKGSRLNDRWPVHLTALALLVGMMVAIASLVQEGSTVLLITFAQALTVLGIPALAAALIYLGTRKELSGDRKTPKPILILATIGLIVSLVLAGLTASKVYAKMNSPELAEVAQTS
ncbi:divalent metal cation transporter [Opitutia bacterium ISCC 51]|nr:divalent metal cation transporter [Opitutae bacterium ISCC 51]QXD27648.1 divalent metal cation transporter [Opitutae bacterium ISCC 52]